MSAEDIPTPLVDHEGADRPMNDGMCDSRDPLYIHPHVCVVLCVPVECCQFCRALPACWASALCCSICMGSTGPEEDSGKAVVHWGR